MKCKVVLEIELDDKEYSMDDMVDIAEDSMRGIDKMGWCVTDVTIKNPNNIVLRRVF